MIIRPMVRDELDVILEWAHGEGWNPGLGDAEVFWQTDPEGFIAAELDGELVGGGSIVAYGETYGFMGLFIVDPDRRGHGLGRELWFARRDLLQDRLAPGAAIEMDGVFAMQAFYAHGGFAFQHRDLRFAGTGVAPLVEANAVEVVDLATIPFGAVEAYDRAHFAAPRASFLSHWVERPGVVAVGVHDDDACRGFAVARPCRDGFKIGPLFADDAVIAEALFDEISARLAGEPIFLDVPEVNAAAIDLAHRHAMTEVFGCARMTLGPPPELPWDEIFGVTTFELG
jgi:GNAT superfamily N-acetyltransferase